MCVIVSADGSGLVPYRSIVQLLCMRVNAFSAACMSQISHGPVREERKGGEGLSRWLVYSTSCDDYSP